MVHGAMLIAACTHGRLKEFETAAKGPEVGGRRVSKCMEILAIYENRPTLPGFLGRGYMDTMSE